MKKFIEKQLFQSFFLRKLRSCSLHIYLSGNPLKRFFSANFTKFLRTIFPWKLQATASNIWIFPNFFSSVTWFQLPSFFGTIFIFYWQLSLCLSLSLSVSLSPSLSYSSIHIFLSVLEGKNRKNIYKNIFDLFNTFRDNVEKWPNIL